MAIIYGGGMTTAGGGTGGAFQDATTTIKGIVRLATLAEAQNGVSQSIAVTPAGLTTVINDLVADAPDLLNTLNELAEAIGNDPEFYQRVDALENNTQQLDANLTALQNEVNAVEAGAGLGAQGAYVINLAANYIANATSLSDADTKIDAKLKEAFDIINAGLGLGAGQILFTEDGDTESGSTRFKFIGLGALPDKSLVIGEDPNYATTVKTDVSVVENYNGTFAALTAQNKSAGAMASTNIYLKDNTASEVSGYAVLGMNNASYNSGVDYVTERAGTTYLSSSDGDLSLVANYNGNARGGQIHFGTNDATKAISIINSGAISIGTTFSSATQTYTYNAGDVDAVLTSKGLNASVVWTAKDTLLADVNSRLDALDTSIGAVDGVMGNFASHAVITENGDLKTAVEELDSYISTMEGGNGVIALQTEVDAIESSVGLQNDGTKSNYSSAQVILQADSHHQAIGKLDARATLNRLDIDALETLTQQHSTDISSLQAFDANITTSVGLEVDGGKSNFASANIIDPTGSFKEAIEALDTEIANLGVNVDAKALQTELDATQAGAGLNVDGSFTTPAGSNYLGSATTIKGALTLLDTQMVNRANDIAGLQVDLGTETTNRTNADSALQVELDATQAGAGLNANGGYTPPEGNQFLTDTTSLKSALLALDQNLATVFNDFDIHHLHSNSYYVNDGASDIQTVHDLADFGQGDVIYVSSGSYGGADLELTKQNFLIQCPASPTGSAICELVERGINISGATCTRVRIVNLQVEDLVTITGTEGRHYFKNVDFLGGLTITNGTTNFIVFEDCAFTGAINIASNVSATVYFNRCTLNNNLVSSLRASPLLTILTECAGLNASQSQLTSNVALVGRTGYANNTVVNNVGSSNYTYNLLTGAQTSFSGSYTELRNKPTIPAASTDLTDTASLLRTSNVGITAGKLVALGNDAKIDISLLPSIVLNNVHVVADAAELANLPNVHTLVEGDVAIQSDDGSSWIWTGTEFLALGSAGGGGGITTINGKTGATVTLETDDIDEPAVNPTNLWFTTQRAVDATVVNSMAGTEQNKAPSVNSLKAYITTALSDYELKADNEAADILTKIKTVDGAGSGLDADLFDGSNSDAFVQTTGAQSIAGVKTFTDAPIVPNQNALTSSTAAANTKYVDDAVAVVTNVQGSTGAVVVKGNYDASTNTPVLTTAKKGYLYNVSAAGTLAGVNLSTTDQIIFVQDVQGGVVASTDFILVDNTETPVSAGNLPVVKIGGATQLQQGIYYVVDSNNSFSVAVPTKAMVSGKTGGIFYLRHRGTGTVTVTCTGVAGGEFLWYTGDSLTPLATFGVKSIALTRAGEYKFVATQIDGAASSFVQWDVTVNNHKAIRTTDDVTEGSTNKYATATSVRSQLSAGTGISYNSTSGAISSTITQYADENAVDAVGAALVTGTHSGISFTYGATQDTANRIDATVSLTAGNVPSPVVALDAPPTTQTLVGGNYYVTASNLQGSAYSITPPTSTTNGEYFYIHVMGGNTVNTTGIAYYFNGSYSGAGQVFTMSTNDVFKFTRFRSGGSSFYYISVSPSVNLRTTSNIAEGTNQYYTDERVDDRVSTLLSAGSHTGISYSYNDAANSLSSTVSLASFSTTNLAEGTNQYFTNERVDDRVDALLTAGTHTGISYTYDDANNKLSSTVSLSGFSTTNLAEGTNQYYTDERVDDRVNGLFSAGTHTGISYTYDDATNKMSSTVSLTLNDLSDVSTTGAQDTNVLAYSSSTGTWAPAIAGGGGGSTYLVNTQYLTADVGGVFSIQTDYDSANTRWDENYVILNPSVDASVWLPTPQSNLVGKKIIIKNISTNALVIRTTNATGSHFYYMSTTSENNITIPSNNVGFSTTLVCVLTTGTTYKWFVV